MEIYLVGGAVRDRLLGRQVKERDWVVLGSSAEEMVSLGYRPVGNDFPVFLHPKTNEEYALARTERKTSAGYQGFDFYTSPDVTLEEDLLRRDLTINAIAEDDAGNLIDPHNGQADLEAKVFKHVSAAFAEDPVRILRVARFAARFSDFSVDPTTKTLMQDMVESGEVDALVPERVWQELHKALHESTPGHFIKVLKDCRALAVILPELDQLYGVPQPAKWHPEIDTGIHTSLVLEQACLLSESTEVRFAALMHDLGKGTTPKDVLPSHHGHEKRGAKMIKKLSQRLRVPNGHRDLAMLAAEFHTHVHKAFDLKPTTLAKTIKRLDAYRKPERFEHFLLTCEADARGRTGLELQPYPQADFYRAAFKAASSIETKDIIESDLEGKYIAEKIEQRRAQAISSLDKNSFN